MADVPMFDQLQEDSPQAQVAPQMAQPQQAAPSFDELQDDSEKAPETSTVGALAQGALKGAVGPLAPWIEKRVFNVPLSDQKQIEEEHPIASGIGQASTLVGGAITGAGEGALMAKAGEMAAEATGLAQGTSLAAKVGSEAVKQAAEMAVLQSSDEVGKLMVQDPEASAQTALANIGMAAAFGGAGGALMGTVSPLWKATVGSKVEQVLGGLKDHLDGTSRLNLPENIESSINTLGIQVEPELRAAMSGDPNAAQMFNELREVQHPSVLKNLKNLEENVNNSVLDAIGKSPEDIANYSESEGGRHAMGTLEKEYRAKYEPISKEFDSLSEPFKEAPVSSVQKGNLGDMIVKTAGEKGYLGEGLPQRKEVDWLLSRVASIRNADDFGKVMTELRNKTTGNFALGGFRRDMQGILENAHHDALSQAMGEKSADLVKRFTAVRGQYADLAKLSRAMSGEIGLGKFVGPKTFLDTLKAKKSPEQLLRALSPKGNADILGFLGQHFPETLESIRDNELKQLLRPAVLGAKGESQINSKILNNAIEKGLAGQPERIKFALPNGALEKIQAANNIMSAIPGMKSSGTAGWQQKLMAHVPQSALAGVAMVTGHNPILGYVGGHIGKLLGRDVPDAIRLGMLRFMASDQPIKAEGFKSMVEFTQNLIKGQALLVRATGNVLKANAQVLTDKEMPSKEDRQKLDEVVEKVDKSPEMLMRLSDSQVGHYLPGQQAALTQTQIQTIQYLQSLKPRPYQTSPLAKPIEPGPEQVSRYNRALDIANQPMVVLNHLKQGTLQTNDIKDLNSMYPGLMRQMQQKLTQGMVGKHSEEEHVPYKTKMGLSLFMGQALDNTMQPMSIISAQPQPPAPPAQGGSPKNTGKLGKSNKMYQTPNQSAEERSSGER